MASESEDDDDGLEFCGQSESLTRRLNNILKDYSDGLSIPKEIIQNADDAGATAVTLIYDSRMNELWRETVIDKRMAECQGPCLWAHNNAQFTDADFKNLLSLGGATKERQAAKVGKFGLGFNAVYNLTDAPAVLSGSWLQLLDPHGEKRGCGFLEQMYRQRGERNTGLRLNFAKQEGCRILRDYPHQFAPFNGVMGCGQDLSAGPYPGTLIRLPLRTPEQAMQSKICKRAYGEADVQDLLVKTAQQARLLLLFTQSVSSFRLLHLREGAQGLETDTLLEVERRVTECIRPLPGTESSDLPAQTRVLVAAVGYLKDEKHVLSGGGDGSFTGEYRIRIDLKVNQEAAQRVGIDARTARTGSEQWMLSVALGSDESLEMSRQGHGVSAPVASVAIRISVECNSPVVSADRGVAFCFLPLPIESPLLFHINAAFAVTSSRRHLEEATMDEADGRWHPGRWNAALLREAACAALVNALQRLAANNTPKAPLIWPLPDTVGRNWRYLVDSFYNTVFSEAAAAPCIFPTTAGWQPMARVIFLDESRLGPAAIGVTAASAVRRLARSLAPPGCGLVEGLAPGVQEAAQCLGLVRKERLWSGELFVSEFLSRLDQLWNSSEEEHFCCEQFLVYLLQSLNRRNVTPQDPTEWLMSSNIRSKLQSSRFLPDMSGNLRLASELLNPDCAAAALYSDTDGVFPRKDFHEHNMLGVLTSLGLRSQVDFDDVLERAKSICSLSLPEDRLQRTRSLMKYLSLNQKEFANRLEELSTVEFLPAMRKPRDCTLHWRSDDYEQNQLFAPRRLFSYDRKNLVVLCELALDESVLKEYSFSYRINLIHSIGVQDNVPWQVAWEQLWLATQNSQIDCRIICLDVYQYLSQLIKNDSALANELKSKLEASDSQAILYTDSGFLQPHQVSLSKIDQECLPYLQRLPSDLRDRWNPDKYIPFLDAVGVQKKFDSTTYCKVLQEMHRNYNGKPLSDSDRKCSVDLLTRLSDLKEEMPDPSEFFAPDQNGVLIRCSELCFGSVAWLSKENLHFTHKDLAYGVCEKLKIPDQRKQTLRKHHLPLPFGQREELTTRLNGILRGYPLGIEIFKELVQNADDAGASRLHFINDNRILRKEKVLSDEWKTLQGPALVIVNDTTFCDDDIEGIQKLGVGSKGSQPWKTGQYGIGFNCVYHVTDVPMFLSDNRVLCVLDPHCKYMPNANSESPGGMYKDDGLEEVREEFRDVFDGFSVECQSAKGCTIFRLPYRTSETAKDSHICSDKKPLDSKGITHLFDEFKKDLAEILLFLTSVRTITLSERAPDGKLHTVFEVNATVSDPSSCSKFRDDCREFGKQLVQPGVDTRLFFPSRPVVYKTTVCSANFLDKNQDTTTTNWLVAQQLGLPNDPKSSVPDAKRSKLGYAIAHGEWKALPKVGVAAHLDVDKSSKRDNVKRRVYNLLPLPLTTELPVHINGHFALDPSRRSLWEAHSSDADAEWNNLLVTAALPCCYATLLEAATKILPQKVEETNVMLQNFYELFPKASHEVPNHWNTMAVKFYQEVFSSKWKLFPVMIKEHLVCLPLAQNSHSADGYAAFLQESLSEDVSIVLRNLGLPLVVRGRNFAKYLKASKVSYVPNVDLETVINFLKGQCCLKLRNSIPTRVEMTPFAGISGVETLMHYLLTSTYETQADDAGQAESQRMNLLFDTPLNLTADGTLRMFTRDKLVFLTKYVRLFPPELDTLVSRFAHKNIQEIFKPADKRFPSEVYSLYHSVDKSHTAFKSGLFQKFSVADFRRCLADFLPDCCSPSSPFIPLDSIELQMRGLELKDWLQDVWRFLDDQYDEIARTKNSSKLQDLLAPVSDTALVPAIIYCKGTMNAPIKYLFKVSHAHSVYRNGGSRLQDLKKSVDEALMQLRAPALATLDNDIVKDLVGHINEPRTILPVLRYALNENAAKPAELPTADMAEIFARFIQENSGAIETKSVNLAHELQQLPIFVTLDGKCIALRGLSSRILPANMVSDEMHLWSNLNQFIFLRENLELEAIHRLMGCKKMSEYAVYIEFILPAFEKFSSRIKLLHLTALQRLCWSFQGLQRSNRSESAAFKTALQSAAIVPRNQTWCKASEFYHDQVNIFTTFLESNQFLPNPYRERDWFPLMQLAGLITECSAELVLRFAHQTASLSIYEAKSQAETLLRFVESSDFKHRTDSLLHDLARTPFIVSDVDPELQQLCPSDYPKFSKLSDCISPKNRFVCWTVLPVAPDFLQHQSCFGQHLRGEPSVTEFWSHVKNLFKAEIFCRANIAENLSKARVKVMHKVYSYMRSLTNEDSKRYLAVLREMHFILVDNNKQFARPMQVTLLKGDEIPPFLFACSDEFLQYAELFQKLGVTRQPDIKQAAMVLQMIREAAPAELPVNFLEPTLKSIRLLLKLLDLRGGFPSDLSLCLPASVESYSSKIYRLVDVRELVINDAEGYAERLGRAALNGIRFLDLDFCKISHDQQRTLERHLVQELNVRRLSDIIKEQLVMEECPECLAGEPGCQICSAISSKLTNSDFREGVASIIVHDSQDAGVESTSRSINDMFENCKIICKQKLVTVLLMNGHRVSGSERPKKFLLQDGAVYMSHLEASPYGDELTFWQKDFVGVVCGLLSTTYNLRADQRGLIQLILQLENSGNIRRLLKEQNIRFFGEDADSENLWRGVELGSLVSPIDTLRLQPLDTRQLKPDALVAFADPEADQKLIYARVIQAHDSENDSYGGDWIREFTIDCGRQRGQRILTRAPLLQTFESVDEAVTSVKELSQNGFDWEQQLERHIIDAAQLPHDRERAAIAQRILNAFEYNDSDDDAANPEAVQRLRSLAHDKLCGGFSDDLWGRMSANAARSGRRYRSARAQSRLDKHFGGFSGGGSSHFGGGGSFRGAVSSGFRTGGGGGGGFSAGIYPSPDDARLYLRTAQGDAEASATDAHACWICYKSWQAAEKAMKAIVLAEGRPAEKSHNLFSHLQLIGDDQLQERLEPLVETLLSVLSRDPRYPRNGATPYDVFPADAARKASEAAMGIVRLAIDAVSDALD